MQLDLEWAGEDKAGTGRERQDDFFFFYKNLFFLKWK